ncbi:hypothetical protein L226DRAFT_247916 [Lentinus tigrinus ALCF2SS1-7]|uniref:uncharacterized protein n=1 Tax=Lentinus tigrinus ALCF2SS1-7 TaxID=1328758 RepID=UPI001166266A|nr:hypothetical protein L226DRAFT_247916 [Lentinus tigrinus ALCF2SS1-7]
MAAFNVRLACAVDRLTRPGGPARWHLVHTEYGLRERKHDRPARNVGESESSTSALHSPWRYRISGLYAQALHTALRVR